MSTSWRKDGQLFRIQHHPASGTGRIRLVDIRRSSDWLEWCIRRASDWLEYGFVLPYGFVFLYVRVFVCLLCVCVCICLCELAIGFGVCLCTFEYVYVNRCIQYLCCVCVCMRLFIMCMQLLSGWIVYKSTFSNSDLICLIACFWHLKHPTLWHLDLPILLVLRRLLFDLTVM